MDAEVVWQAWRKLLRDESLQKKLFEKNWNPQTCDGLSEEEKEAISAYSNNVERAKWFIENYQFRLVNSFVNALENGAPLTLRALINRRLDLKQLSRQFLRDHQWHDYGPKVYGYCAAVLLWLRENAQEWDLPAPLVDLIKLESEVVALYLSLHQGDQPSMPGAGYSRTGMARYYRSQFQLSNWLRSKKDIGLNAPDFLEEHFFIVLPDLKSRHKFLRVPQRCAQLYQSPPVAGSPLSENDLSHLNHLVSANVLRLEEGASEVC